MTSALTLLGWSLALAWLVYAVRALGFLKNARLSRLAEPAGAGPWPRVSLIVPARNEESHIAGCLTSLLDLDYPDFEVIAADDRSTDGTGLVMDRLAAGHARLTVVHIDELPTGWLGKTHALQRGAERATGRYLVFTDGDVVFTRDALRLAVSYVRERRVDHLCLLPRALTHGYWETALTQFLGLLYVLGSRPWDVNRSAEDAYAGIGAFNLVRADAYRSFGGHSAVRLDVVDDMALGRMFRQRGLRSHILMGNDLLSLRWQSGVAGLIRGIEKNSFAAMGYSMGRLCLLTLLFVLVFFVPYLALAGLPEASSWGYAATVLILHGLFACWNRLAGHSWRVGLAVPVAAPLALWALWRSAVLALRRGGIRWRDTFYSLEVLRGHRGTD
jgi:glycosyltransferase involved in cell wall biosynthesis